MVFLRGQSVIESLATQLHPHLQEGGALVGWRLFTWFGMADDDARASVLNLHDDDTRFILLSTEGLGAGKTFPSVMTVISSCRVNRPRQEPNSKQAVTQEGGDVRS